MNADCPNCGTALEVENPDGSDVVCPACNIAVTLLRPTPPPLVRQITASERHPVAIAVGAAIAVVVVVAVGIGLNRWQKAVALEVQAREMVQAKMATHAAEVRAQNKRDNEEAARRAIEHRFNQAIANREVLIGMNATQVKAAWGKPQSINVSGGHGIDHEQWVYGMGTYLYFENGKLTFWQDTKKP